MKFSELQELLNNKLGINHLADIARELDVSPQAVSNWKARDNVPYKYIVKLRNQFDGDDIEDNKLRTDAIGIENQNFHNNVNKISITDFFLLIAKELKIIIFSIISFCIVTTIYVLFIVDPVYKSNSKFISSSGANNNSSQALGIAAQFGINLNTNTNYEPERAYTDIIKSRTLAKSMLKQKFDTKKFGLQKSLFHILLPSSSSKSNNLEKNQSIAIENFINMIDISQDIKTGVYNLTVSAFESKLASDINSRLIKEFDKNQRKYKKEKTYETRKFIDERIVSTKKELEAAEESLRDFTDRNRRIMNSPSLLLEQQRLSREVSVLTGVFTTLKQQLETAKIEEVKDSDSIIILDYPEIPFIRSSPKRKFSVIFASLIGLLFGIIMAFLKNYFSNNQNEDHQKLIIAKSIILNFFKSLLPKYFIKTQKS